MVRHGHQFPASMLHDDCWLSAPFSDTPQCVRCKVPFATMGVHLTDRWIALNSHEGR